MHVNDSNAEERSVKFALNNFAPMEQRFQKNKDIDKVSYILLSKLYLKAKTLFVRFVVHHKTTGLGPQEGNRG